MALSLKPEHLKRYKDIARLLIQHGRSDLIKAANTDLPEEEVAQEVTGDPERLARDLEELGPTFIKLGQLLSTRSDLLPAPYLEALSRLQKIANRIALGLVLAALIVGAALLMQVRTRFTLFGYPGLAMLLFLLAAGCGFLLVLSVLLNDDWRVWRKRPR